jgi:hypothetical protein
MARAGKYFRRHRRDTAEKPIVDGLRARGYVVSRVGGKGLPDIIVRQKGQRDAAAWCFEVKTGNAERTDAQEFTQWPIVRTVEDALQAIGANR